MGYAEHLLKPTEKKKEALKMILSNMYNKGKDAGEKEFRERYSTILNK